VGSVVGDCALSVSSSFSHISIGCRISLSLCQRLAVAVVVVDDSQSELRMRQSILYGNLSTGTMSRGDIRYMGMNLNSPRTPRNPRITY
jgi:hypothetical protein